MVIVEIFVFDAPVLFVLGFALALVHAKKIRRRNPDFFVLMWHLFILTFWLNALLSGLGLISPWGGPPIGYAPDVNTWIGVFYVLSYPFWFWYGGELAFGFFGRTPQQGGLIWLFTLRDRTEPFEPEWEE